MRGATRMTQQRGSRGRQSGMTLVELLVAMTIMGVLSVMIISTWFSLQSSWAASSQSAKQRDTARQAVWRMATEIRDAQNAAGYPPVITAGSNSITIATSFNNAGNDVQPTNPLDVDATVHRVRFTYDPTTKIVYRTEDTDFDSLLSDETSQPLIGNVVNGSVPAGGSTPVFRYSYYDSAGVLRTVDSMTTAGIDSSRVLNVQIRLLVDIKPNKSPGFLDLRTTALPRNAQR